MYPELVALLRANVNQPLSPELAADIMVIASQVPTLVPFDALERIKPEQHGDFTFQRELIEDITDEIRDLHEAHWKETEEHRHALSLNPDYDAFVRYERAGRYVLFTVRYHGMLLGNCAMYLDTSTHTQTLLATEDTLYLLPDARRGRMASQFVAYVERALKQLGAREISITVKKVNKAERFFRTLGYRHVENGLTKILEG